GSPRRVNSQPGSAIATGTIRGAKLAVAPDGRVHVAWNGSNAAQPASPVDPATGKAGAAMLYTRMDARGERFEPQRSVITRTTGVDGGGAIATDTDGHVFVAWHANGLPASTSGPRTGQG